MKEFEIRLLVCTFRRPRGASRGEPDGSSSDASDRRVQRALDLAGALTARPAGSGDDSALGEPCSP